MRPNRATDNRIPNGNTCAWTQARLYDFLDVQLSMSERARVQAHLDDCPNCLRELVERQKAESVLSAAASSLPSPGDLRSEFYARLAAEKRVAPRGRFGWSLAIPALACGALAFLFWRSDPMRPAPTTEADITARTTAPMPEPLRDGPKAVKEDRLALIRPSGHTPSSADKPKSRPSALDTNRTMARVHSPDVRAARNQPETTTMHTADSRANETALERGPTGTGSALHNETRTGSNGVVASIAAPPFASEAEQPASGNALALAATADIDELQIEVEDEVRGFAARMRQVGTVSEDAEGAVISLDAEETNE
jgi:anti-sigma factor (TIGR02949 family)